MFINVTDGVTSSGYQDMSVSRDSLYTGRDPGGGSREIGAGAGGTSKKDGTQLVPNPPGKPASVRLGHQRQYSDPFTAVDKEPATSKYNLFYNLIVFFFLACLFLKKKLCYYYHLLLLCKNFLCNPLL